MTVVAIVDRMAPRDAMLRAARKYLDRGWRVLPVERDKSPVGSLVPHGLRDATGDATRVARWLESNPAGIGVVVPVDHAVLDVDPRNGGDATLADLEREHGPLPVTLTCETGGGGLHLWFELPDGGGTRLRGKLGPGLDIRADARAYLVAPPSAIHDTGRAYRWREEDAAIAQAPAWLVDLLTSKPRVEESPRVDEPAPLRDVEDRRVDWAKAYAKKFEPAVSGQHGHDATFVACMKIVRGFDLTGREAFDVLSDWNRGNDPPWDRADLERKISEAARNGEMPRGALLDEARRIAKERRARAEARRTTGAPAPTTAPASTASAKSGASSRPATPPRPPETEARDDLTESAHAETIARTRSDELRCVTSWGGRWIAWDGVRWSLDRGREVAERAPKRIAAELFERAAEAGDDREAKHLAAAATRLRKASTRESVVSLARWESAIAIHHDELDRGAEHLLVTPSGTVDLRTGKVAPNDPARLLTRASSTPYEDDARCPTWERFVDEIAGGDAELAGYLQRAAGYSLTGSVAEHIVFFLFGAGANGKSTFVEVLLHVLGDYAKPLRSEALMSSQTAQHPTTWASLVGVRLAVASEVERGARLAESLVKSVTGGDSVTARRMREDFWTFRPQFKLWLLGNDKPVVRGADEGIWRRLRLVPFVVSFIGREDRDLPARLRAEAPGILRWAVDGAREWHAEGLAEPNCVREATSSYRASQDVFGQWVDDALELAPLRTATAAELRKSYETWCDEHGAHRLGPREYSERLSKLGVTARRGNRGRYWEGVGLARVEP